MAEKQSMIISRDAQLTILLKHKWQTEIESAVDKIKLGVVLCMKRSQADKWFRRQWYRSMMRDRRRRKLDDNFSENKMSIKHKRIVSEHKF